MLFYLRRMCGCMVRTEPGGSKASKLKRTINGVFTRSSKRPAIHVYFEYICWKFAGRLIDCVNTL